MPLSVGIIGLPNVGKSTLFNALAHANVDAHNFPFCTIEPNRGIVPIPDPRLEALAELVHTDLIVHATITFVDIAGLVKGASHGEGLGNKFLSHVRDAAVLVHVVRCFADPNVVHVHGRVDPEADLEIVDAELMLADLEAAEGWQLQAEKSAKSAAEGSARERRDLLVRAHAALVAGRPVRALDLSDRDRELLADYPFLTLKPVIYIANISEDLLGKPNPLVDAVGAYALRHRDAAVVLCAEAEAQMGALSPADKQEFLAALGIPESGLDAIIHTAFTWLGLQTFLTVESKIVRSWIIPRDATALAAAGTIHTDFAKGFIRANVVAFDALLKAGGFKEARAQGVLRQEGRDYIMKDGDVVEFLFNV